jgi:hypothetical protein
MVKTVAQMPRSVVSVGLNTKCVFCVESLQPIEIQAVFFAAKSP